MPAMIWDSATSAFKEADTPKIWDSTNQAWKDTEGYVYQNGAWVERWTGRYYLVKNGRRVVAGGEDYTTHGGGTISYGTDYVTFTPNPNDTDAGVGFIWRNIKNPKSYTKICIEYSGVATLRPNYNQWNGIEFYGPTTSTYYITLELPLFTQKTTQKNEITNSNLLSALTTGYTILFGKIYWCGTATIYNVWFE